MKLRMEYLEKYFDQNREISFMGKEDLFQQRVKIEELKK